VAPARQPSERIFAVLSQTVRAHLRSVIPIGAAVAVGVLVVAGLVALYAQTISVFFFDQVAQLATTAGNLTALSTVLMAPIALLAVLATLVWAGIAVQLSYAAINVRRVSTGGAALHALRRAPRALVVVLFIAVCFLGAVLIAPVLLVLGVLGLLLVAVAEHSDNEALARRAARLPERSTLIALAVPFGVAVLLLVRWSLAPASVWLADSGIRASLRDSSARVRSHSALVGATLLVAALITLGATEGFVALVALGGGGPYPEFVARVIAIIVIGPLLFAASAVHYRRGGVENGVDAPPAAPSVRPRVSRLARTAVIVVVALLVPLVVSGSPAPASAVSGGFESAVDIEPSSSPVFADTPTEFNIFVSRPAYAEGAQPTGEIAITIDGVVQTGPFELDGYGIGSPYVITRTFTAGSHTIESTYAGDDTYDSSSDSFTFTAGYSTAIALATTQSPAVYGSATSLTATLTTAGAAPTGDVEISARFTGGSWNVIGTTAVSSGVATLDISSLAPGSYELGARYLGDSTHLDVWQSGLSHAVTGANTTTSFAVTPTTPSAAGDTLTAHVSVAAPTSAATPTGSVDIYLNGSGSPLGNATLSGGTADATFALPPGVNQTVTAIYTPGTGFFASQTELSHTVSPYTGDVSLAASDAESVFGQSLELTATVSAGGTATGSVSFAATPSTGAPIALGSATVDGSGEAVLDTTALPVGDYSIVASYSGDSSVDAGDSGGLAHSVAKATTSVDVVSNAASTEFGFDPTLTITVTPVAPGVGTPSGTVTVSLDGTELDTVSVNGSGVATLVVDAGDTGDHTFTAAYSGDSSFVDVSGTADVTVTQLDTAIYLPGPYDRLDVYGDDQTYEGVVIGKPRTDPDGSVPTGTVQLWIHDRISAVGTLNSTGGYSITTDLGTVGVAGHLESWVTYLGDTNYAPSNSRAWSDTSTSVIDQADVSPVVTSNPAADTLGIGSAVTFFATMPHLGAGATGDVDFYRNGVKIGTGTISDDVASFDYTLADTNSTITAEYLGDKNFAASTSAAFYIIADRNAVVIALADPGPLEYSSVIDLVATVTIGPGVTPAYGVTFRTTSNRVLASNVPIDAAGKATLTVCAGDADGCPDGAILLGTGADGIHVTYPETATNLPGLSPTVDYVLESAATTTTVTVSSATVAPGDIIELTATVAGVASPATPTNYVTFYGSNPVDGGGTALAFIGNATLTGGVATLLVEVGADSADLRWPADAIVADYFGGGTQFASSRGTTPITIARAPVTFGLPFVDAVAYGSTPVTVHLSHAARAIGSYSGKVVITADSGSSCSQWVAVGERSVTCDLSWPGAGDDSYTVTYSGDIVSAPSTSVETVVEVDAATPVLGATTPPSPIVGMDTTVNWTQFHPGATGTVTVWGNGAVWCEAVPLSDESCTGQFDYTAATGSPVGITVHYSGDSNWNFAEQFLSVTVARCADLDVRSSNTRMGTVTVDTEPNCGETGFLTGTKVTVSAEPIAPNEFVRWRWYGTTGSELVNGSVAETTSFTVTTDPFTWVHIGDFELPCYAVTANATGSGTIWGYPTSNCTTDAGDAGYLHGTAVKIYPTPQFNRSYNEKDVFYSFGTQAAGATIVVDSAVTSHVATTVTGTTAIPVTFGPRCRTVSVSFDPASDGDVSSVAEEENCQSPLGNGYVRGSAVTVSAVPGDDNYVLAGWAIDGVDQPELGTDSAPTLHVGTTNLTATAQFLACYTFDALVSGASNEYGRIVGIVHSDGIANCPDGSDRYTAGTVITLTPEVRAEGTSFSGWDDQRLSTRLVPEEESGIGLVTDAERTVTITTDLTVTANFFLDSACSRLSVFGQTSLMTFDNTGCGVGYYFDQQKVNAIRSGVKASEIWKFGQRTTLQVTIPEDEPLSVYASVRGDVRGCFGTIDQSTGPSTDLGWKTYGPLAPGFNECGVGGTIDVRLEACQSVRAYPELHVVGDDQVFTNASLPRSMYVVGPDGTVGSLSLRGFGWMQSMNVTVNTDSISYSEMAGGPCQDAGNAFPAGSDVAIYALSPTSGFRFDGWANVFPNTLIEAIEAEDLDVVLPDLLPANPMLRTTNETDRSMTVTAAYTVTCHHLALGEGITVVGLIPRCPGTEPAENMYIEGSVVQTRAAYAVGGRQNYGYTDGVISNQVTKDALTLDLLGFVLMTGNRSVAADYPNKTEKFERGVIQGLKISAGVFAVAAPIAIGLMFPPMGLFFAVVAAGAGIASLAGDDKTASVFDMMNPTSMATCAARWAFDNSGQSTGAYNAGAIASVGKTGYDIVQGKDILMKPIADLRSLPLGVGAKLPDKLANFPGGLSFALAAAGFGYGLYAAGIGDTPTGVQTVEQLRGTATMTGCVDEKLRFAGANTSGS